MQFPRLVRGMAMTALCVAIMALGLVAAGGSGASAQNTVENPSGLPVPRFVSLRSNEVNLRTGPGLTHPIEWVYQRKGLPVLVIGEFDTWRQIRDYEGTEGWVHQSMIDGERSFMVIDAQRAAHLTPQPEAKVAVRMDPGVIGQLLECDATNWCLVSVQGYRGWVERGEIWGSLDGEVFR
ncbi:MAG: SH3 domain-containing protein [Dongiaceae bacterium]